MSLGPHFSAVAGSPAAVGSDFAATAFSDTSGLRQPVVSASSSACESTSDPLCEPDCKTTGRAGTAGADRDGFADRRRSGGNRGASERRQFGSSHAGLSPDAKELAVAIDQYKLAFRRRYITCEEMLAVITQLGYRRVDQP